MFAAACLLHFCCLFLPVQGKFILWVAALLRQVRRTGSGTCHQGAEEGTSSEGSLSFPLNRVEDHDDLMPIFLHHDTVLKETYGEYFLAELIEAQDEENHAVVCEVRDYPPAPPPPM